MGMGTFQSRCTRQASRNQLQKELPGLSCSSSVNGLVIRTRLPSPQIEIANKGSDKHVRKMFDRENCSAKVSVANDRWSWNDCRSPVHAARETGCCPD